MGVWVLSKVHKLTLISDKLDKGQAHPRWTYYYHRTFVLGGVGLTPRHRNRVCQCVLSFADLRSKGWATLAYYAKNEEASAAGHTTRAGGGSPWVETGMVGGTGMRFFCESPSFCLAFFFFFFFFFFF